MAAAVSCLVWSLLHLTEAADVRRATGLDASAASRPAAAGPQHARPPAAASDTRALPPPGPSAEARLLQAKETLDRYRESTRYPPESRPAHEHEDQLYPGLELERRVPLNRDPGGTGIVLRLSQDRVFLVGDERARLSLRCETDDGEPAPCTIVGASATSRPPRDERSPRALVRFEPDPVDASSGSAYVASVHPATQGFEDQLENIRVTVTVKAGQWEGYAGFDLQYTPRPPALFTGKVREVLEQGSLSLYMELKVANPGRYILAARVEDAAGQPLAYLSFNEVLGRGTQHPRFVVFGRLIRDQQAATPFYIRDVEGFLLKEDSNPDRELIPGLAGTVHTTRAYALEQFSDAEWQSEQRSRYLREFTKDVAEAQAALR